MLRKQRFFKCMSPCSWLSLIVLMGWGSAIETFVTIHCHPDQDLENKTKIVVVKATEEKTKNNSCEKHNVRGCGEERLIPEISGIS